MNIQEAKKLIKKKPKYGNKKVEGFDSVREKNRYSVLLLMQKQGIISNLERQVKYELIPSQYENGKCIEKATSYYADFQFVQDGKTIVEDSKGCRTDVYKIKKKLMLQVHGIKIKET